MFVCFCVSACVFMQACGSMNVRTCILYVCMYVCMYVCVYVCTCVNKETLGARMASDFP